MQKKTSTDKPAAVGKTASIEQVLAYLRMHPTFFAEHPELLKSQRLPGQDQGQDTVSLWQRQNQLLRTELEEQQQRLQQLSRAAISNEQLLNRWHSLTLDLMATADTVKFLELVDARLRKDFGADYVVLQLIDTQFEGTDLLQVAMVQRAAADYLPELQQMLASTSAYCGRLIADKREAVFGDDRPASVTLVAIEQLAVLAIGSDDADRFAPGMGGLFIELLGKTVAWQLQRHVKAFRKQA